MGGVDWYNVDWGLTNKELAGLTAVTPGHVGVQRRSYAPHTVRRRYAWESIDWTMSNDELALELDCSIQSVINRRKNKNRKKK